MKRRLATIYAILCTLLMVAGFVLVFFFAWRAGTVSAALALVGILLGVIFSPILHELGHITLGYVMQMECVYAKFFCLQIQVSKGKKRLSFASPFAPDQTQMLPKNGGDMGSRAKWYTAGGLLIEGGFFLLLLSAAILCACVGKTNYLFWGILPYAGYLFLLNALPFEYASGKTDALILAGLAKGAPAEKCMLSAMEIQGQLMQGKSFKEIEKEWYFNLPQLSEEEPLYALLLDLRYRYFLDNEELEKAADCLNRLARSEAYLSDSEVENLAAELVYMHALRGDIAAAEESAKPCKAFLLGESATAKRILAAFSLAAGKIEDAEDLKEQAREALCLEQIAGVKKFEESLLNRIKTP